MAVNPYRGCEHGCVYCYARPTHAYLGYSPGLDFETRLVAKANAVEALRAELSRPGYKPSPINIGSATDAYQPIEREWRLTRGLLELMLETRHPLTIVTKNALVARDLDLLAELARRNLVVVYMSVTTLDAAMARSLEPRAAAPWRRLEAVRSLTDAGVPVGVLVAPIIPFINDESMEHILEAAKAAGAHTPATRSCACPGRSRPCSRTGCTPISRIAPSASCIASKTCAAVAATIPTLVRACVAPASGPTCCASVFPWPRASWA